NNFDAVFEILARLLVVENVRPDAFNRARQDHLNKVKSVKLTPAEQADEVFHKTIYGDHPYGHNIDGSEATVSGIKQADIYDYLKRFYIANNVSAIVVGNITRERVMRPFKAFFGGWSKGQTVPATFRQPAQTVQLKLVKVEVFDTPNVELRGGMIGVRSSDPDFIGAEVVSQVLNARLKREAESIGGSFAPPTAPPRPVSPFLLFGVNPRRSGVRVLTQSDREFRVARRRPRFSRRAPGREIEPGGRTRRAFGRTLPARNRGLQVAQKLSFEPQGEHRKDHRRRRATRRKASLRRQRDDRCGAGPGERKFQKQSVISFFRTSNLEIRGLKFAYAVAC